MNADQFRKLALGMPEAEEGEHQGHADFRVGGKIFATLGPDEGQAMVRLPPQEQTEFVETEPDTFEVLAGAWGRQGATRLHLRGARKSSVRQALVAAWFARAPKRLAREHDAERS